MKYSILKGQQKEDILLINGNQSVCPFAAPIPFQGNMGQIQIMRMPCSSLCPHSEVNENNFIIKCGKDKTVFSLAGDLFPNDSPEKTQGKIISL